MGRRLRRGQSSVEPLLVGSVVVLVGLAVCSWQFEALLAVVHEVSVELQTTAFFDQIVEWVSA